MNENYYEDDAVDIEGELKDEVQDFEEEDLVDVTDEEIIKDAETENLINEKEDSAEVVNIVKQYMADIKARNLPLLTAEDELELGKKIYDGHIAEEELEEDNDLDDVTIEELERIADEGDDAANMLAECNLRLVISTVKRYNRPGVEFLDLIQEGNLELINLVQQYDYRKGYRFSTYAVKPIRRVCVRYITEQCGNRLKMTQHNVETLRQIEEAITGFKEQYNRNPSSGELAKFIGVSKRHIDEYLEYSRQTLISINTPIGDEEEETLADTIEDVNAVNPEKETIDGTRKTKRQLLEEPVTHLTELQAVIIGLRYGLLSKKKMSYDSIGREIAEVTDGVCNLERRVVKRTEQEGLRTLYKALFEGDVPAEQGA